MKAPAFDYARPDTLAAALALLGDDTRDAQPLAGGQSLMPMMNFRVAAPDLLVDLNRIEGLSGVSEDTGHLRIGAMTRYAALMRDPLIARHVPLFAMALPHVAHAAIRNRGTIGGSVALADPAAEMPALLRVLDATIELTGAAGTRLVAADDFFLGMYDTARAPGELVTAIVVPHPEEGQVFGFHEIARRHGDYAMAGVALSLRLHGGRVAAPRIAFFAVADRAVRAPAAEAALTGLSLQDAAAAPWPLEELPVEGDLNAAPGTKRHLAGVVLKRALEGMAA